MSSQVTNIMILYFASALDLAIIVSFISMILNYLQQEHNTLKWSVYGDPT